MTTTQPETPAHLQPKITDRGFQHLPMIPDRNGGGVRVYESSNASGPHVWLMVEDELTNSEAIVQLSLEALQQFVDQAQYLIANHYQVEPAPAQPSIEDQIKAAKAQALRKEAEWWREAARAASGPAGHTMAKTVAATIELHAIEAED